MESNKWRRNGGAVGAAEKTEPLTVEVPVAGHVGVDAQHGPAPLPELEAVLLNRRLQVLRGLVRGGVVGASPVAPALDVGVAWVPGEAALHGAPVERRVKPVGEQEAVHVLQ